MSWFRHYAASSIGMKQLMGITGLLLVLFVIAHLAANLLVFAGPDAINAYGHGLRQIPVLLWMARIGLLATVLVHIFAGLRLTAINKAARPIKYKVFKASTTPFYARIMPWTGLVLAAYIVYHLLHFTIGVINAEHFMQDSAGRHDVYAMVVLGFRHPLVSAWYIIATAMLCFHLAHGIPSFIQTMGLDNPKYREPIRVIGPVVAVLIFVGLASIPIAVMSGIVHL